MRKLKPNELKHVHGGTCAGSGSGVVPAGTDTDSVSCSASNASRSAS